MRDTALITSGGIIGTMSSFVLQEWNLKVAIAAGIVTIIFVLYKLVRSVIIDVCSAIKYYKKHNESGSD